MTHRSTDGRALGPRGQQTRKAILRSLSRRLADTPYQKLSVQRVAYMAGQTDVNFYRYFTNIDAAVLALADEVADEGYNADFTSPYEWRTLATATRIVADFCALYARHRPILRVVELRAAEGYTEYAATRAHFLYGLQVGLEQAASRHRPDASDEALSALVAPLVGMLAALAAHPAQDNAVQGTRRRSSMPL
ncbi:hypothetical protein [Streptomyces xiamenensis]|uniref:hypothetical protein n=1 Tax=Streptomyces xiamenensis TaxID=408015 RepID=UPI0037D0688B